MRQSLIKLGFSRPHLAMAVLSILAGLSSCSGNQEVNPPPAVFDEHLKAGSLSLVIVGDYFHNGYILELALTAKALSPQTEQIIVCTDKYKQALTPFLRSNGVENVRYVPVHESSPILTQWARDVAVAGKKGEGHTVVVSPFKHASTETEAAVVAHFLEQILPERNIVLAPFVFESGNLAFVRSGERHILIVGRKVLFDNELYQGRLWAPGFDSHSLLSAMEEAFGVDTVMVVGRAKIRPATRVYFEYHIDMGMAILSNNRAVVAKLTHSDEDKTKLSRAITNRHPIISPFLADGQDPETVRGILTQRLETVALEYDDYALVLEDLGYRVSRSTVGWREVLSSMSWTNVLQTPGQIVMPLYPDSVRGRTLSVTNRGGQLSLSVDVEGIVDERFELTGSNATNYGLYSDLGYDVVAVPEYLHYMMGGLHCFVNILE
jgi:N-dimethylarginine dimethylaminohydrolase